MNEFHKINIKGISSSVLYEDGTIESCILSERNELTTPFGVLIPRYSSPDERKKDNKTLSFYPSGALQSVALETQTPIQTSLGIFPAELLTFYENGTIDSLFPLNGKISFGWTEADENSLAQTFNFSFPFGSFKSKIIALRFYSSGALKSLILWPGEMAEIKTPIGEILIRTGFRLYENGSIMSLEPAYPTEIITKIGAIMAFDHLALGIDSDLNSVKLNPDGTLYQLSTNSDIVINNLVTKERFLFYQQMKIDMESDRMMKIPVKINFEGDNVILDNGKDKPCFSLLNSKFLFLYDGSYQQKKCSPGSDCSNCGGNCL